MNTENNGTIQENKLNKYIRRDSLSRVLNIFNRINKNDGFFIVVNKKQ